jgi:hypothetical protein
VVARGREHGVPTPASEFVYTALKPYVNGPATGLRLAARTRHGRAGDQVKYDKSHMGPSSPRGHPTEAEAYQEADRLAPRGFNRERISLWVVPWTERFA